MLLAGQDGTWSVHLAFIDVGLGAAAQDDPDDFEEPEQVEATRERTRQKLESQMQLSVPRGLCENVLRENLSHAQGRQAGQPHGTW
jgi:hypothetical protein